MSKLPTIDEIYPFCVKIKHKGFKWELGGFLVKWLEENDLKVVKDFDFELTYDDDRSAFRFKTKKSAKFFKEHKKSLRNEFFNK